MFWTVLCAGSLSAATTDVSDVENKPGLQDVVYSLGKQISIAAELGPTPEAAEGLRNARAKVLAFTRENAGGRLTKSDWALPFSTCYEWSLSYELFTYKQAEEAIKEAIRILKEIPLAASKHPENPHNTENINLAAYVASGIVSLYVDCWMEANAPECVKLLDEVEDWVLSLSDEARMEWYLSMMYTQGNLLFKEDQFDLPAREWLWQSRQKRMRTYIEYEQLHLIARTRIISHWSRALYFAGDNNGAAERLMTWWWGKYAEQLDDPEFFAQYMRVLLFEAGDWERAGELLERANVLSEKWTDPTPRASYEKTANLYYKNIFFLDYELRRTRGIDMNERREKRKGNLK
ncbi:MAG: hypothetical protein ACOYCD_07990 [Kiritimatiellia bacterium]